MINKLSALTLITLLYSCSLIVEVDKGREDIILKEKERSQFICSKESRFQTISQTKNASDLVQRINVKHKLSPRENFVTLILGEMLYSPHIFSPDAKMQVFIGTQSKENYAFYNGEEGLIPALNKILKEDTKSRDLTTLATYVNSFSEERITISDRFSSYLHEYKDKLYLLPNYKKYYFRAGQILKEGETIPKINLKNLANKELRVNKKASIQNFLFDYKNGENNYKCNFDLNIYDNSIFMVSDTSRVFRAQVGIKSGKESFFATISFIPELNKKAADFLFYSSKKVTPSALCYDTSSKDVYISSKGPDPGQLLHKHIVKMSNVKNEDEFERALLAPRFLILVPPKRLILETKRTKLSELEYLQGLNMPIYHTDSIGNIWGSFEERLFKDMRTRDQLLCN